MTAHTPGPWRELYTRIDDCNGYQICHMDLHGKSEAERDANRKLIAAAPDLLSAAQAMLAAWNAMLPENKLFKAGAADDLENIEFREMQALRRAIEKAAGGQS